MEGQMSYLLNKIDASYFRNPKLAARAEWAKARKDFRWWFYCKTAEDFFAFSGYWLMKKAGIIWVSRKIKKWKQA
jgi:hypothetical protein